MPCFADDSGFCVEALKNNPGVKSKRFLKKLKNLKKVGAHSHQMLKLNLNMVKNYSRYLALPMTQVFVLKL